MPDGKEQGKQDKKIAPMFPSGRVVCQVLLPLNVF
jgi:hypothetical protein